VKQLQNRKSHTTKSVVVEEEVIRGLQRAEPTHTNVVTGLKNLTPNEIIFGWKPVAKKSPSEQ